MCAVMGQHDQLDRINEWNYPASPTPLVNINDQINQLESNGNNEPLRRKELRRSNVAAASIYHRYGNESSMQSASKRLIGCKFSGHHLN